MHALVLVEGRLPWQGYQGDNKGFLVCKKKMATSPEALCRYTPSAFRQFMEAVINLKFDEEPKYGAMSSLFEPLCGTVARRPISTEGARKVGMKRKVADMQFDDSDRDRLKKKFASVYRRNNGSRFATRTAR